MTILRKSFDSFTLEDVDEENRTFTGVATTVNQDRVNDIVVPTGAKYILPISLLMHHEPTEPCGEVQIATISDNQIQVTCHIPSVLEDGDVKRIVDKAWHSIKYKLIKGLSIGFIPNWETAELIDGGGVRFNEWEWYELSLVTIPCNRESQIDTVKTLSEYKAALGVTQKTAVDGVSSKQKHVTVKLNNPKGGIKL